MPHIDQASVLAPLACAYIANLLHGSLGFCVVPLVVTHHSDGYTTYLYVTCIFVVFTLSAFVRINVFIMFTFGSFAPVKSLAGNIVSEMAFDMLRETLNHILNSW